ncbi:BtpA family membrane complex biogenesis protein, partial [bacterium]|nr:BtpA family membrane complex biogenesis protein [bacterium]
QEAGFAAVMIENMHDIPYTRQVSPEIPAIMAIIAAQIKRMGLYCGVQVLAACNREALAVACVAGVDFVRVEGFVFGHVADEGYIDACAGELMRYRRQIGAEDVMILADIKKKHCSHAITVDVGLRETTEAAAFFGVDGVIITGSSTGKVADTADLISIKDLKLLKAIGSGLTSQNINEYIGLADLFIVGSSLKTDGIWSNSPEKSRTKIFHETFSALQASL